MPSENVSLVSLTFLQQSETGSDGENENEKQKNRVIVHWKLVRKYYDGVPISMPWNVMNHVLQGTFLEWRQNFCFCVCSNFTMVNYKRTEKIQIMPKFLARFLGFLGSFSLCVLFFSLLNYLLAIVWELQKSNIAMTKRTNDLLHRWNQINFIWKALQNNTITEQHKYIYEWKIQASYSSWVILRTDGCWKWAHEMRKWRKLL